MAIDQKALEERLKKVAQKRLAETSDERKDTMFLAEYGHRFDAEEAAARKRAAVERTIGGIGRAQDDLSGAEIRQGPRDNFIPVSFLETGAMVARPVMRVSLFGGLETGTGFLISPHLVLTNHHVVPNEENAEDAEIEFDFEADARGRSRDTTVFRLDPARCFVTDDVDGLDYTVVAVGPVLSGTRRLEEFGFNPLSASGSKHALGEFANIIQHPDGRQKEVVLQDNLIAGRTDKALHYVSDTEPGSSGSPVFNNAWQVIALHHWGTAKDELTRDAGYDADTVNEGIRISSIVRNMTERLDGMHSAQSEAVKQALELGTTYSPREVARRVSHGPTAAAPTWKDNQDGTVTWQVPVEITVGIPGLSAPQITRQPDVSVPGSPETGNRPSGPEARSPENLAKSSGYDADFIDGVPIPLPELAGGLDDEAVILKERYRQAGRPDFELTYTHFSVVMHRSRKLAMLTAVNIDGSKLFGLTRDDGERYLYDTSSTALLGRIREGAESSSWFFDDRIERAQQTGSDFYDRSRNNSLVKPKNRGFKQTADFERGHIVRRLDPVWGDSTDIGLMADADSHAWTNVAPQTATFNRNNRDAKDIDPGEEKRLWAAAENAILRNAFVDQSRLTVFGGPVFSDKDPVYAGLEDNGYQRQVPMAFWKVVCWKAQDGLRSLALLIEQEATLKKRTGAEALDDPTELLALRDFLTTVPKLEDRISMRFCDAVRKADVWRRHEDRAVTDLSRQDFIDLVAT